MVQDLYTLPCLCLYMWELRSDRYLGEERAMEGDIFHLGVCGTSLVAASWCEVQCVHVFLPRSGAWNLTFS